MPGPAPLAERIENLRAWLESSALPLWWEKGAGHPDFGFFERMGQNGSPVIADNRRARVQPRQAYCYATAGKAGWSGPWREAVKHGLSWFEQVYRLRNGFYGNLADMRGKLIDPSFDLYNQAFALLAGAAAASAQPEMLGQVAGRAEDILNNLRMDYAHPLGGFEEDIPQREPLCSNPHMHLFEAALAWEEVTGGGEPWRSLADDLARLATGRFIDTQTGALREFFNHRWEPMPGEQGRVVEPGHQFEWAWLLARWASKRNETGVLAKAEKLFSIGEEHGVCPRRQVAIMRLNDDFTPADGMARFWPQTEWLKAAMRLASLAEGEKRARYLASAGRALDAMAPFLTTPVAGLWYDKWPEQGGLVDEPAPASTFYHIVCAIYEAQAMLDVMKMRP